MTNTILSSTVSGNTWINSVPITNGGTGAITQATALSNLLGSSLIPIANGGTNAATQAAALTNILGSSLIPLANGGTNTALASGTVGQYLSSTGTGSTVWTTPEYFYTRVALNGTALRALFTTPFQLLPAVSGSVYVIHRVVASISFNTAAYTGGGAMTLGYNNGGSIIQSLALTIPATTVTGSTGSVLNQLWSTGGASATAIIGNTNPTYNGIVGTAIAIKAATANFAGATAAGILNIDLYYSLVVI